MRHPLYRMDPAAARAFLAEVPCVRMALPGPGGRPILRTLHGVVVGDAIAFHGSPAGDKTLPDGTPVAVVADEVVARIPSYFIDPERACPATTYYRSVHVEGVLAGVTDPERKAAVLQALMKRYQPEGGHVPIAASHPLYRASVAGLRVYQVGLERLSGKAKLGQNRNPAELARVLEHLWHRGAPGDPRAIALVRQANPGVPDPPFLAAPGGVRLECAPEPSDAAAASRLLAQTYWNDGIGQSALVAAHLRSTAWVGAREMATGVLVGSARAMSDGAKHAWIYDVVVHTRWRGRGVGKALVRLVLDHPAVRDVLNVHLATRDAQGLYARFGFLDRRDLPPRPWRTTEMILQRPVPTHGKMAVP